MSALDSGKPFDELTDEEMAELAAHDWTPDQIKAAIRMALEMREMEAVVDLLGRLALKAPRDAAAILAAIEAT